MSNFIGVVGAQNKINIFSTSALQHWTATMVKRQWLRLRSHFVLTYKVQKAEVSEVQHFELSVSHTHTHTHTHTRSTETTCI